MDTRQAKDFLVEQAATQAAIENIPLTDIEKRMMYFTESDPTSCPDPISLNEEFEAEFDTPEYEAKMSQLFEHARRRLRQEDPERARRWNEAVGELQKGDHYILVLLYFTAPTERPKHDFLRIIGTALLIVAGFFVLIFVSIKFNFDLEPWIGPLIAVFLLGCLMFSRQGRGLLDALIARLK